jgi:hypothetical protein
MRILSTDPLFPWDKLPLSVDLLALRHLLELIPDQKLLEALREHRGKGRDDYPVHILWRIHLARYFLRHAHMEACLAEVGRNPALRGVLGLEQGQPIPDGYNMSRFLLVLGQEQHQVLMQEAFGQMVGRLAEAVPDLGRDVAGDSAALCGRVGTAAEEGSSALPQPAGGRKEYKDEKGKVVKAYEWFGYKFHLLVDVKHEVVLACRITSAAGEGTGDCSVLPELLEQAQRVLPQGRMRTLAFDKAADDEKTHQLLLECGIRPVIEIRQMWKEQTEQMLPGHDGTSNVTFDETGTVFCHDKTSEIPVKHKMSFVGFEKARGTVKYRCPARQEGFECPSDKRCNGCGSYGKTVRVRCELDPRRFPSIPRSTPGFTRQYNGRTAVERINSRVKVVWGADDGNVAGAERFHAHLMTIMLVHAAMAHWLAMQPRYEGKSLSPTRMSQIALRLEKAARPARA